MTQEMADAYFNQYLPHIFVGFVVLCLVLIINTHRRWNRIADSFRTQMKLPKDNFSAIQIDGRNFRKLVIEAVDQGLYLAHWGLLPQLMMPKRVLIPWTSVSKIFSKKRSALGFTVEEYFLNISGSSTVELKIPADVAREILKKNYLKQE
jgi:hypothetical protein